MTPFETAFFLGLVPTVAILLPGQLLMILVDWLLRPRPANGRCRRCDYDLTGNVTGRCPECGVWWSSNAEASQHR